MSFGLLVGLKLGIKGETYPEAAHSIFKIHEILSLKYMEVVETIYKHCMWKNGIF